MNRWLSVIGLGEDGLAGLDAHARALVDEAEVLVGGDRHLAMVPDDGRERLTWTSPLSILIDDIVARRGQRVCVLATGDPMCYGVGVTLARRIPAAEMTVIPRPSAFALACARLGWARERTETLTLHGRPVELVIPTLQPGARVLALSDGAATPRAVVALLVKHGYGESRVTVFEHMDGPAERRLEATARAWPYDEIADLNTIAIECVAAADAPLLPRVPGLSDDAYAHDGQITKREVRAATLAALAPVPGQLLWDVGAGAGSVGIEWMRCDAANRAVAIERNPARAATVRANAAGLGVPRLAVVEGEAPAALAGLEAPDAVFIGGGLASGGLVAACWEALVPGGRLVANAVTLEGEQVLARGRAELGGELVRFDIQRAEAIGGLTGWKPLRPVVQWAARKK